MLRIVVEWFVRVDATCSMWGWVRIKLNVKAKKPLISVLVLSVDSQFWYIFKFIPLNELHWNFNQITDSPMWLKSKGDLWVFEFEVGINSNPLCWSNLHWLRPIPIPTPILMHSLDNSTIKMRHSGIIHKVIWDGLPWVCIEFCDLKF